MERGEAIHSSISLRKRIVSSQMGLRKMDLVILEDRCIRRANVLQHLVVILGVGASQEGFFWKPRMQQLTSGQRVRLGVWVIRSY